MGMTSLSGEVGADATISSDINGPDGIVFLRFSGDGCLEISMSADRAAEVVRVLLSSVMAMDDFRAREGA